MDRLSAQPQGFASSREATRSTAGNRRLGSWPPRSTRTEALAIGLSRAQGRQRSVLRAVLPSQSAWRLSGYERATVQAAAVV
jgi:hypothetical protein